MYDIVAIMTVVLGISANLYEAAVLRAYSLGPLGERGAQLRDVYEWIEQNTLAEAVTQHNPDTEIEYYHALYGHRQVILADQTLGRLYGISDEMFNELYDEIIPIFELPLSKEEVLHKTDILGVDFYRREGRRPYLGRLFKLDAIP